MSIIYDKRSPYWKMDNFEFNKLFVKSQLNYARNLYRASGYIYLERLYTVLGVEWNPYAENKCWILKRDGELDWSIIYDNTDETKIEIIISISENA